MWFLAWQQLCRKNKKKMLTNLGKDMMKIVIFRSFTYNAIYTQTTQIYENLFIKKYRRSKNSVFDEVVSNCNFHKFVEDEDITCLSDFFNLVFLSQSTITNLFAPKNALWYSKNFLRTNYTAKFNGLRSIQKAFGIDKIQSMRRWKFGIPSTH